MGMDRYTIFYLYQVRHMYRYDAWQNERSAGLWMQSYLSGIGLGTHTASDTTAD